MKYKSDIYESDIAEMIHENKMTEFKLGLISEARMREYDKLCLTKKALQNKTAQGANAQGIIAPEAVNIEHGDIPALRKRKAYIIIKMYEKLLLC